MAREPVTFEEAVAACDQLVARQQRPTVRLLRQTIGRGSFTTMRQFLAAWREARAEAAPPAAAAEALRALEALAPQACATVRAAFRAEVEQELVAARSAAERERAHAEEVADALRAADEERAVLSHQVEVLEARQRELLDQVKAVEDGISARLESVVGHLTGVIAENAQRVERVSRDTLSEVCRVIDARIAAAESVLIARVQAERASGDQWAARLAADVIASVDQATADVMEGVETASRATRSGRRQHVELLWAARKLVGLPRRR